MKTAAFRSPSDQLPRRDILAICVYLNRNNGTKAVDACVTGHGVFLDKVADAARMQ
jgi:hypothetical protein